MRGASGREGSQKSKRQFITFANMSAGRGDGWANQKMALRAEAANVCAGGRLSGRESC
jgi:hypothetical protein